MNKLNIKPRTIFCKDNLEILEGINSNCIDLIYLDPPFNTKKVFTAPIGSSAEGAEFSDIFRKEDIKNEWVKSIEFESPYLHNFLQYTRVDDISYNYCYLVYMAIRLIECRRILKTTGSIYLHCDPIMSHYLKIILDCIFGESNFRNEIIWQRMKGAKGSQHVPKSWGVITDSILFYTKSENYTIVPIRPITDKEISVEFPLRDDAGKPYKNDSAHIFCNPSMGARPNLCFEWRGFTNPHLSGWRLSKSRLEEEYQKGNIVIKPNGRLERRKYLKDYKGKPLGNNWTDINIAQGKERTGYPTQKPLALLERIINASSNEGDVVLDPFCGCATTCVAAEKLDRQWIGIDISQKAYELVKMRLEKEVPSDMLRADPKFTTTTPIRNETKEEAQGGYVYVIKNDNWEGMYKVGITKDVKKRLNSYQTSDPYRAYTAVYEKQTPYYREIEKHIHTSALFKADYEWVEGDLAEIIAEIENYNPLIETSSNQDKKATQ